MFILGFLTGMFFGVSLMALVAFNRIEESDSLVRARTKALKRAEREITTCKSEIVDLRNNLELVVNDSKNDKIKELVIDSQSNN